ncbi:RHTO0S19e01178g1_1 [Rhodotorula toruloides]|uniref:RHTO0S19e01178g1_1 n=1 Tax=Rhodotorula toruloides TaxID=5286 RepID=A0A061BNL2_RHOTO|nr:RHTO0S19e01178g1_1 [Rhodotorula toruloides]
MGLAAKLAAANAGASPCPAPSFGQAAPPAAAPQPAFDPTKDVNAVLRVLEDGVKDQNISHFYPPGSLKPIAERIVRTGALTQIAQSWHLPYELAMDLARLALFDVALLLDDSASMQFFENGVRIDELRMMVGNIATAAGLFDSDGIEVRWLNSKKEGNGFTTEAQVVELIGRVKWDRATPLGTAMKHKILEPLVYKKIKKNALKKPLLIISVTDGAPTAEPRDEIVKVIIEARDKLSKTPYTPDAVSFQFAQVGNDLEARQFLEEIDSHPKIGSLVDTCSNFENESDDMAKANPPVHLTRELWLTKLLLGPIHSGWDSSDEK